MADTRLQLEHLNLPARDPHALAHWYGQSFGLRTEQRGQAHLARGPGVLLVFKAGEPVNRKNEVHVGLRVPSRAALAAWAEKFGQQIGEGEEFATFQTYDPEGNCIEVYCPVGD